MEGLPIIISLTVLLLWTASNSLVKKSLMGMESGLVSLTLISLGLIPIFLFLFLSGDFNISWILLINGLFSGFFLATGYILFYMGMGKESLSSVGVTLNLQQVIVIFIGIFLLGEAGNYLEFIGIGMIIMGAILVSIRGTPIKKKFFMIAALANISWGVYYIPLSESVMDYHISAMPLFLARILGTTLILIFMELRFAQLVKVSSARLSIIVTIIAGLLDGTGNVFYAYSIQSGFFVLSGSIVAMIPATVAIVGFYIFKDKMTYLKFSGIILSIMGALTISFL